jgi:hypothetical protein
VSFVPSIAPLEITQTVEGPGLGAVTPVPTLGPGQYFEEDDPNRPDIAYREGGDAQYGYGPLAVDPNLYAMWVSDRNGTHYYIVHRDSEVLRGGIDPEGGRYPNGFDDLIEERRGILNAIQERVTARDSNDETSESLLLGSLLFLGGAGVCVAFTLGACGVFVGVAGAFLVPSFMTQGDARQAESERQDLVVRLADVQGRLTGRFALGGAALPNP